jgi:hypothetical protein
MVTHRHVDTIQKEIKNYQGRAASNGLMFITSFIGELLKSAAHGERCYGSQGRNYFLLNPENTKYNCRTLFSGNFSVLIKWRQLPF